MSHLSTLQSTWTNGQSQIYQGTGVFKFTYDDDVPASSVGGTSSHPSATYQNVITAATFEFNNVTFNLDISADNTIGIHVLDGAGTDATISLQLRDPNNTPYLLKMEFEDVNRQFSNYALSNLMGLFTKENATFLFQTADQTNPGKHALYQQSPLAVVSTAHTPGNVNVKH